MPRLLHLSDTHLLGPGSTSPHPHIDPEARLTAVLAAATAAGPFDAVVVTGDLADDGSDEAVQRVRDFVRPLAPIVVAAPGNHDVTDVVAQAFGTDPVRVGAWQIRAAATNVPGEVAGRADPVLDLLDECEGPTVVLMHHPVRSRSTHPWFTLRGASQLEQRLRDHRSPLVMLSGHLHQAFDGTVGGTRLYGAPATFYGIAHDGDEWTPHGAPTGALVVDLDDEGSSRAHLIQA
ncbi:metallophosphoesterase [Allobranchiibius sp. CTAmp26]|uniref:metallophosphoesterase family protein n=1 Tax=Allobranchiibius sp. CTAmp26 TaxID=2815214 RepID=UPI001AA18B76|nr:metallophosphoesterase [Allobranchiibius sp. CTAmp26]MBO1754900.1 metallophosphoesterase [Allobranchiibius sp. CTAmp26]